MRFRHHRSAIVRSIEAVALVFALSGATVVADTVVPGPDVTSRVIVRASASAQSTQVASLAPGQQAELTGSVPNWYEVRTSTGVSGFVSKRWTRVVPSSGPPPASPGSASPAFTIDVLDVGRGLSVLVRGSDFALLYDGGSNDDQNSGLWLANIPSGTNRQNH